MKKMFSPRCVTSVILLVSLLLAGGALAQGLPEKWDDEADVVVVGYGAAGAAAAAEAHDAGADVLLLEKLAFPGGNALLCGGAVYGAGTSVQKELGIDDSPEQMAKYYEQIKPGLNKPEFIEIISAKSAEAVEWLLSHGAKVPAKYGVPGLTAGGFENLYEHITPARTRSHWVEGGGPGLFAAFKNAVDSRGIRVRFNTPATRLIRNPATGDIVGVRAVPERQRAGHQGQEGRRSSHWRLRPQQGNVEGLCSWRRWLSRRQGQPGRNRRRHLDGPGNGGCLVGNA